MNASEALQLRRTLLAAKTATREGSVREARGHFLSAVQLQPKSADVRMHASDGLLQLGFVADALAVLDVEHPPSDALRLLHCRARTCFRVGRYAEGVAAYRRLFGGPAPDAVAARVELARKLASVGDFEAALDHVHSLPAAPDTGGGVRLQRERIVWQLALDRRDDARHALKQMQSSNASAEHVAWCAAQWIRIGDFDAARSVLHTALDLDDARILALWGTLALWRGETDVARAAAARIQALPTAPEGPRAPGERKTSPPAIVAMLLGAVADALDGRYDTAARVLERLLEAEPHHPEGLLWRGETLRRSGRLEEAVRDIDAGIQYTAGYSPAAHASRLLAVIERDALAGFFSTSLELDAYRELAQIVEPARRSLGVVDERDPKRMLEVVLEACAGNRSARATFLTPQGELRPLDAPAHTRFVARQVQELIRVRSADEVRERLAELGRERPGEPTIACHRGELELWLGDAEAARSAFLAAIAQTTKVRWAYVGLCAAELLAGDDHAALNWCERGIEVVPPPGRTMYAYRGEALRRLGRNDEARADFETMMSLTPERPSTWINLALLDAARGKPRSLLDTLSRLWRAAPGLVNDAMAECGHAPHDPLPEAEALAHLFEHMLRMMRGNRSSNFVSYFTRDGTMRFVPRPQ